MKQRQHIASNCGQSTGSCITTNEVAIPKSVGPWIVEVVGPVQGYATVCLRHGERLLIGSGPDVGLRVKDACVSGRHCVLDASGHELLLRDLASKNGILWAGARVDNARITGDPAMFVVGTTTIAVRCARGEISATGNDLIEGLRGRSDPMQQLRREIRRVAKLRAPVLILGESGVGKDVVARALHKLSGRKGAYLPINMATVPESLADSELFGHSKGAFTGAAHNRMGAFAQADGGTLFLDEVGELALCVQAKMLRVLEDGLVRPVGATEGRKVDVRIVSATWASLKDLSAAGRFRFDLLQRLSVMVIEVPPLRERLNDIPELVEHWLRQYHAEIGPRRLSERAIEHLKSYDWPGNVRELGGVVYRACVMADTDLVEIADVARAMDVQTKRSLHDERNLQDYLVLARGNVSEAARRAGLPRTTFRTWLSRSQRRGSDQSGR